VNITPCEHQKQQYELWRARYLADPTNPDVACAFAKACFEWACCIAKKDQKAAVAEEGIQVCRKLLISDHGSACGHYYLASNLGVLAEAKRGLEALGMLKEMESEFKSAARLKPEIDFAGPDRGLGNLYWKAPGWPISIGDKKKAEKHQKKAVSAAADFPENHLCLIEALDDWGDEKLIHKILPVLDQIMQTALGVFIGDEWAGAWIDWEKRWRTIRTKHAKCGHDK
jgi:hypothetical protein